MSERPNAYRVQVYTYSTIVGHLIGRQRADEYDRTFRHLEQAEDYAAKRSGLMSFLVPYMLWQSEIVPVAMPDDWRSSEEKETSLIMAGIGAVLVAAVIAVVWL